MRASALFGAVLICGLCLAVHAQTVVATLSTGLQPVSVAVNPATNKIYVANSVSGTVSVIEGATNSTATVNAGVSPNSIAINTATNKIYVANQGSDNLTVIDGVTNSTTIVAAGDGPISVAVNPVTNKIYVANQSSANVTVIDGATNATSTVAAGNSPYSVAVNPVTDKIYVANSVGGNVTVIDGATGQTVTVPAGASPISIAVNAVTNRIYVANRDSANITVIDGSTNQSVTVGAGANPLSVGLNPVTNKIYVANLPRDVTVIDGATNSTTVIAAEGFPARVAVNTLTNQIYIANALGNMVTVIDGRTNLTTTVATGAQPGPLAVNPVTNKIYVTNVASSNVTVIDGATYSTSTVATGVFPISVAVNPVTNKMYVTNYRSRDVTVIDGSNNSTTNVGVGDGPGFVAVNPATNKVYVTNNSVYSVTVIDGVTNSTGDIFLGAYPLAVTVNPVTNRIYIGHTGDSVMVIDGAAPCVSQPPTIPSCVTNVPVGRSPAELAVNLGTNKVYVGSEFGNILTVMDGKTNSTTPVTVGTNPASMAVNPLTNKIYVANADSDNVTIIDGATNAPTTVVAGAFPHSVVANPVTNKIYVANGNSRNVTVIDGVSGATSTIAAGFAPYYLQVNLVTNKVYVPNVGSDNVTVITEQQVQPVPLTTAISPLPNNVAATPTPTFTFTATSTFSPNAPAVQDVLYQVDTWQGKWSSSLPSFSGTTAPLLPGMHTLYAFAIDGQAATSTQAGSPLIGNITAYSFLVVPTPQTITFATLGARTYGDVFSLSAITTSGLTVTFTSTTPTVCVVSGNAVRLVAVGTCSITASQAGTVSIAAAPNVIQSFQVNRATLTVTAQDATKPFGAALPPLQVAISGFVNGDSSAVLTGTASASTTATATSPVGSYPITVNATLAAANYIFNFVNGTLTIVPATTSLALTGLVPGNTAPPGQAFTLTFSVVGAPGATPPGGTITYSVDAGAPQTAPVTAGIAAVTLAGLATGAHTVSASYGGDGNYLASGSQTLTLTVGKVAALLSLAVSPATTAQVGQVFTVAFVLTPGGAVPAPTGTITYTVDSGSPQAVTLTAGRASATISGLFVGTRTVTVNYSGDANYLPAGPQTLTLTVILGTPVISSGGVVSAGGFTVRLSPGGLGAIFGTSLAGAAVSVSSLPLPTTLGGVQVLVNGIAAPLLYVSPAQINFQVPFEAPAGSPVTVQLVQGGQPGPTVTVTFTGYAPAVFTYQRAPGQLDPVIVHTDNTLVTPEKPAAPGEILTIYATGAGSLNNAPPSGAAAPTTPLATTRDLPTVTVGGASAIVQFSGLTPGFVGLLQINIQLPATLPAGPSLPLVITFPGASSAPVNLWVKN